MPKQINHIFNRKKLQSSIAGFDFASLPASLEIQGIISRWLNLLDSHRLDGQGEVAIHGDFLIDIFSGMLGYKRITGHEEEWNLTHEQKTFTDATKADGALGFFTSNSQDIRAVIELKAPYTDLDARQYRQQGKISPVEQAFSYSHKSGKKCAWIILSNFDEVRLYHQSSSSEYERFQISKLSEPLEFKRFYYLLSAGNLISKEASSAIEELYIRNEADEASISKEFYNHYKQMRLHLFEHIKKHNPDRDQLLLLEKTQKILDRFIFICFCEDTRLLPEKVFRNLINRVKASFVIEENRMWQELKGLFKAIDKGLESRGINAFNGSLFAQDPEMDSLTITDVMFEELAKITDYDFESELNVNILGHIFEQSISDLEEFRHQIKAEKSSRKRGKRKKEGVYYTPEHITAYMVENSIGRWLEDSKKELGFYELPQLTDEDFQSIWTSNKIKYNKNIQLHIQFWDAYLERVANIKILDPACGSGAFLNKAFDFLYSEMQLVSLKKSKLKAGLVDMYDLDKHILGNNLFGVDLNRESVEITKLSLWIKTANTKSPLTTLDHNIKCGNSLVDDVEVAGSKAFNWNRQFQDIISSGGFDIILSNPPYGAALTIEEKNLFKTIFSDVHVRMPDTFNYFLSRSLSLLKTNGFISFIVPNNLLFQNEYEKARRLLLNNYKIIDVINLGDNVFEDANVPTCIFLANSVEQKDYSFNYKDLRRHEKGKLQFIPALSAESTTKLDMLTVPSLVFGISRDELNILQKIKQQSCTIDDIALEVANGIQPTGDKIFRTRHDFAIENNFETPLLKNVIVGSDFNRYELIPPHKYVIYTNKNVDISEFPNIKAYLENHKEQLSKKRETKKGMLPWWCLHWPRYKELFEEPKIVIRQTADEIIATFDETGYYAMNNVIILKLKPDIDIHYKFLLACLNSKTGSFLYKKFTQENQRSFAEVKPINVRKLLIPKISVSMQLLIIEEVDAIMDLKTQLRDTVEKFTRFISKTYHLAQISGKLKRFHTSSFEEFADDLKLQKVDLTLNDRFQLMDLFQQQRQKAINLCSQIAEKDISIDKQIYGYYGFSETEIEIIEKFL